MKKRNRSLFMMMFLACMILAALIPGKTTQAASKSTKAKNEAAHKAYKKKLKSIAKSNIYEYDNEYRECYYYIDITGDGVDELFVQFHEFHGGSSDTIRFYTYKKNKVECILNTNIYGLNNFNYYKKTKSIRFESAGHGDEIHSYFKYSKGKYKKLTSKYRKSKAGGGWKNGPWHYCDAKEKTISSSKYKKLVKNLPKGSKKKVKWEKFKLYIYTQE